MIKTVIVDLFTFAPSYPEIGREIAEWIGITKNEFLDGVDARTPSDVFCSILRGEKECTEQKYLATLLNCTHWKISPENLGRLIRFYLSGALDSAFLGIMEGLRKQKYRLVLIGDIPKEWERAITDVHSESFKVFEERFLSFELGGVKSDPGIFQAVLEKLGAKSHECIFVGDLRSDILMAEDCGMATVLVSHNNPSGDLHAAFKRCGIAA